MDNEAIRDLVLKHDAVIMQQSSTIEHLVKVQSELSKEIKASNKRLEELTSFLTKQHIFQNRLDSLDRELTESFNRVHKRVDEIENTQKGDSGCNSVKLVTKDVISVTREVNRLVGIVEEHRLNLERLDRAQARSISPTAIRWSAGFIVAYLISFGTYVVQTFNRLERTDAKISTLLERDVKDIAKIMERIR